MWDECSKDLSFRVFFLFIREKLRCMAFLAGIGVEIMRKKTKNRKHIKGDDEDAYKRMKKKVKMHTVKRKLERARKMAEEKQYSECIHCTWCVLISWELIWKGYMFSQWKPLPNDLWFCRDSQTWKTHHKIFISTKLFYRIQPSVSTGFE